MKKRKIEEFTEEEIKKGREIGNAIWDISNCKSTLCSICGEFLLPFYKEIIQMGKIAQKLNEEIPKSLVIDSNE